jgi:hypothetical protein
MGKRCVECSFWSTTKKANYRYGICKNPGSVSPRDKTIAEINGFYSEEVTRNKRKTRPWHICDIAPELIAVNPRSEKMAKQKEREGWSTKDPVAVLLSEIREAGVPIPKAIEGMDKEDIFPSTNSLTDKELGGLLFKYGALKGYIMWLLFTAEIEYNNVHKAFTILHGEAIHKLEVESEKKRLKEGLEAIAIRSDEDLKKLYKRDMKLENKVKGYRYLLDIYSSHWDTVSREITRRGDEIKTGMRQANLT